MKMKKSMHGVVDPYGLGLIVILIGGWFIGLPDEAGQATQSEQVISQSSVQASSEQQVEINSASDK